MLNLQCYLAFRPSRWPVVMEPSRSSRFEARLQWLNPCVIHQLAPRWVFLNLCWCRTGSFRLANVGKTLGITVEAIARGRSGRFVPAGICWWLSGPSPG
jgi:hypothetical protein